MSMCVCVSDFWNSKKTHTFSSFLVVAAVKALWVAYVPAAVTSLEELAG